MRDADQPEELEDEDSGLATEAEVSCPYCGELVILSLDPAGGVVQEYIEDCQVCCRPWRVQVSYGDEGAVEVAVEPAE
jgi:cysteine-rich CPXCG protein